MRVDRLGLVALIVSTLLAISGAIAVVQIQENSDTIAANDRAARMRLTMSQRAGCERIKRDRVVNARAWRQAEKARRADRDLRTAAIYAGVALDLEQRGRVVCARVYPLPD